MSERYYLTYGALPENPPYGVFLYCSRCDGRYSAARGDYFWIPADSPVMCAVKHRSAPMTLAREQVHIVEVER